MTTDQKFWLVVGGMTVFWLAFTYFVSKQPGPRQWWGYGQRSPQERRELDEAKKKLNERM